MPGVTVVVPCYNEAARLPGPALLSLIEHADTSLLLVDDGSSDDTLRQLEGLKTQSTGRVDVLALAPNAGKAEAVRAGMLQALEAGASVVGYLDADLATPVEEMRRLIEVQAQGNWTVVMGSRVAILGADIQRNALRHYLGRVFATAASVALDTPVYDTQCGAKLFRDGDALRGALSTPFASKWAFDVELLGRLIDGGVMPHDDIVEVPLRRWVDVPGSTMKPAAMLRAGLDVVAIGARRRLLRRKPSS